MPHPFIPTELHGDYYKGHAVTHKPPQGEGSLPASVFGNFPSKVKEAKQAPAGGVQKPYKKNKQPKNKVQESRILKTPRYVHKTHILPGSDGVRLMDGKYDDLKNRLCKRGNSHCSRQSKKSANRKSSTTSKIKAHAKSHSNSSQKRKGSQGFAGKTKPMRKEKTPAGGRGTSHTKKGRK